uniref:VQ domain-containing protein n=1 Tax=Meloidogyne floridensis TaxID=298350 RepID=A0A915NPY5_9BILA
MIFILFFKLILLNIFIQNIIVYCVYGTNGNNIPDGNHIQNDQNTNFGQNPNINSYMMPDSAPMNPQIPGQKRKKQRNSMPTPTTFIKVDVKDFRSQVQQLTGLDTGLPPQPMTSFMQYQQSQLYPDSNATGYVHPSTNAGPSDLDHNQHFLQNNSQGNQDASSVDRVAPRTFDNHHITHPTNFGNQGGIALDHNLNLHNFGHSIQHSQPWMEGHNSNINLSLGTQSYLGNMHSVEATPKTLLPNFQPPYQSGSQINSAFVPYKSQIPQEMYNPYMSRNHQSDYNSEPSNSSMNQNSGKMLANEEESKTVNDVQTSGEVVLEECLCQFVVQRKESSNKAAEDPLFHLRSLPQIRVDIDLSG